MPVPADEPATRARAERLFVGIALALTLAAGTLQIRYGEVYPPHGLARGDSFFYAWMARDYPGSILAKKLDAYRVRRSLPPLAVYSALNVLGRPASTDREVVRPFQVFNLLLLLATVLLWNGIARAAALSLGGRWLGFLLFFVNFACLKFFFYVPVLTDPSATFIGTLLLYAHLRRHTWLIVSALLAGAFTWPALLLPGGFLLFFPRRELDASTEAARTWVWRVGLTVGVAYAFALAFSLLFPVEYLRSGTLVPVNHRLLPLSIPIAVVSVAAAFGWLLGHPALVRPSTYLQRLARGPALVFAMLVVVVQMASTWYSSGAPSVNPGDSFLRYLVAQPALRPAQALVGHAVFFGVLALMLMAWWPDACRAAHRLGLGVTLYGASLVALSLSSETRQLLHGLPLLVLLAVMAVEDLRFPRWAPWALVALALLASKVWFGINGEDGFFPKSHPFTYRAQYWFMNVGPWMADEMYLVQGAFVLSALLVVILVRRGSRPLTADERAEVRPSIRAVLAFPAAAVLMMVPVALVEIPARLVLAHRMSAAGVDPLSRPHPTLGWENTPGAEARLRGAEYDVTVRLNSDGLRGPAAGPKPAGLRRVLFLGGSAAEAYNVPEEASVRTRLEQDLRQAGCTRAEVVNAGVAGYGTEQQALLFERLGPRYSPDAVVVLFHYEDVAEDLRRELQRRPAGREPRVPPQLRQARRPLMPWRRSAALRLLSNTTADGAPGLHRTLGGWGLVDYGAPPPELWAYAQREPSQAAWNRNEGILRAMAEAVRASGASLFLVYVPARFEIVEGEWDRLMQRHRASPRFWKADRVARQLQRITAGLGVPFVDPSDRLRAAGRPVYLESDDLWTEAGHAVAARALGAVLAKPLACGGP